ncbi:MULTISPECIES: alpha/beta hydrolase [unclassified Fibrobacter]|uniref:alpha/beta hydrolase n=1 Tax=unclassified Fibrobacter TaxID=2634177 RepID=UPI0011B24954|nr:MULTISPECIES: alpha/beta hydrolase [unclassified Fibrobacter]
MIKEFFFRVLRFIGVLGVIYISMVFYLALTERQKAFPRAITHKEANEAISGKAKGISCTLEDGTLLGGWMMGNGTAPILLYYPDAEEDAAQFLAEVGEHPNFTLVSFNYRGGGNNKGTPSQETFESDANQIAQCAAQVNESGFAYIAGRGIGAILAAKQGLIPAYNKTPLLFIDPVFSIADAISSKYGFLYPKFLIRADVSIEPDQLKNLEQRASIIYDQSQFELRTNENSVSLVTSRKILRKGNPLKEVFSNLSK